MEAVLKAFGEHGLLGLVLLGVGLGLWKLSAGIGKVLTEGFAGLKSGMESLGLSNESGMEKLGKSHTETVQIILTDWRLDRAGDREVREEHGRQLERLTTVLAGAGITVPRT